MLCKTGKTVGIAMLMATLTTPAVAETHNFNVALSNGQWTCTAAPGDSQADAANFVVVIRATGGSLTAWTLAYGAKTPQDLQPDKTVPNQVEASVALTQVTRASLSLSGQVTKTGDTTSMGVSCALPAPFADLEATAQAWWTSPQGQAAVSKMHLPPNTRLIVHLPTGVVALPSPASLSESHNYQLAIIVDQSLSTEGTSWHGDVTVTTCSTRDPFRINGDSLSTLSPAPATGTKQARVADFELILVGPPLACGATQMVYALRVSLGTETTDPVTTSWQVSPFYHLSTTFAPGFDFSKAVAYPVVSGKVTQTNDAVGLTFDVGFTWYPWGADFTAMRWYNHVANPFALFKVSAPTAGLIVGTAFTVDGGISIGIGASVNKSAVLVGNSVGDTFTGSGTPQTRTTWNKQGVGWYVGVLLDQNVFKVLKGLTSSATPSAGKS